MIARPFKFRRARFQVSARKAGKMPPQDNEWAGVSFAYAAFLSMPVVPPCKGISGCWHRRVFVRVLDSAFRQRSASR